ncbi:hypothetical protein ACFFK0_09150 [Paenibacillus chartarius]|uniref:S-adenosylmethionine decarboxylase n=1 Tax=Paenibacillus chartarius TaxID=747481 RepID=A0ABV6DJ01_9BACL
MNIKLKRIAWAGAIAAAVLWSTVQTVGALRIGQHRSGNAVIQLYEVAELQIELLGSTLKQSVGAKQAAELEPLKQAVYTASFTHERLATAVGEDRMPPLNSLKELSQLMLRLQLSGARPVKAEEVQLLQKAADVYDELESAYDQLLSSRGEVVSSQSRALAEADDKLLKLLKKESLK